MTEYIKKLIEEKPANDSFKYMMLDRMKQDCNYYLGNGNRLKKVLWANDEKEHIENMKALWNSFPDDAKPEWLTIEQIEEYEKEMTETREKELEKMLYEMCETYENDCSKCPRKKECDEYIKFSSDNK